MDLAARKYYFIQSLASVEKESVMEALERVLEDEKYAEQQISSSHVNELDKRLEDYSKKPEDLLDWQEVKKSW